MLSHCFDTVTESFQFNQTCRSIYIFDRKAAFDVNTFDVRLQEFDGLIISWNNFHLIA